MNLVLVVQLLKEIDEFARQIDYLGRSLNLIQEEWPFVHAACYFEFYDQGLTTPRKGLFGLFDQYFHIKDSGLIFIRKVVLKSLSTTKISIPLDIYPSGPIQTYTPYFSWPINPNPPIYHLWVNDYAISNIGGRIREYLTPEEAHFPTNKDLYCRFDSSIKFTKDGGQWFVYVYDKRNRTVWIDQFFRVE